MHGSNLRVLMLIMWCSWNKSTSLYERPDWPSDGQAHWIKLSLRLHISQGLSNMSLQNEFPFIIVRFTDFRVTDFWQILCFNDFLYWESIHKSEITFWIHLMTSNLHGVQIWFQPNRNKPEVNINWRKKLLLWNGIWYKVI